MTGPYTANKQHGKWQVFAKEGYLQSEGPYVEGNQKGLWKYYDASRQLIQKFTLKGGMCSGMGWIYKDGKLIGKGILTGLPKRYKINGEFETYHPNGKVKDVGPYMLSKKNGDFKEYWPSGRLQAEGKYMNMKRDGIWIFYKPDGKTRDMTKSGYYMMDKLKPKLTPKNF